MIIKKKPKDDCFRSRRRWRWRWLWFLVWSLLLIGSFSLLPLLPPKEYSHYPLLVQRHDNDGILSIDYDYHQACNHSTSTKIQESWEWIDTTLAGYPNAKVSGGIFLYPRQSSLLATLTRHFVVASSSPSSPSSSRPVTICETGFGAGHSLALLAHHAAVSKQSVLIISFDKFDRPYQLPIWKKLNHTFGNNLLKLEFVAGDSCRTVPKALQNIRCDILHGSSLCPTDSIDLVQHSSAGALLTSTAMDSLQDKAVYFGPQAQWRKLRQDQCIQKIVCFQEQPLALGRDVWFAKTGQTLHHKFCTAQTTGQCRNSKTATAASIHGDDSVKNRHGVISEVALERLCPECQVSVPI